jgi:DNA repair exonuclease SbcCD ATPase subunit
MIIFKTLRYKNILSTGNYFTEIKLDASPNTLIIGKNGAGKSTILDALCFVLFGKAFRKINKPNLINSINQKDCVVEIEFSIGNRNYKVIRGIKPAIFEIYCNGTLVNQDAKSKDYQDHLEKIILKLNFKSFTQIVILGSSSFVPFMQMSAADRRSIIEELLDIEIFSSMHNLVKLKLFELKDSIQKVKYDIELIGEKIKLQKQHIEDGKKQNQTEIDKKLSEIESNKASILKLETDNNLIQQHVDILIKKIADKSSKEDKSKKMLQLEAKIESTITKAEKELKFFNEHDECPTCEQFIEKSFRDTKIIDITHNINSKKTGLTEIENEISKLNTRLSEINQISKNITEHNNEIIKNISTITEIQKFISKLLAEIESLSANKNISENDNEKLKDLKSDLSTQIKNAESLMSEKQYYDLAGSLLKDTGIKTKIIKQYLPIMNKLINKYLTAMDFFVNFNINENFEETILSRHRDTFTYDSFSEGEKLRIDLALLFTWRHIAKMKNSTNTNLLILDEVFDSSLDAVGTDEFMKLIYNMGSDTNIFIISHKSDILYDKFKSTIKFTKKNNFSQIES